MDTHFRLFSFYFINSVLEVIFSPVNNLFLSGERGVMGPPGKMSVIEMTHMKEVMKGEKGDSGHAGNPGFTGPRGKYSYLICCYSVYESKK